MKTSEFFNVDITINYSGLDIEKNYNSLLLAER